MQGIRTNAAAAMLGVSPNTLRSWERRYGFPRPHRSPGGHRQYALGQIEVLRLTLAETQNVSSAVMLAEERGEGPPNAWRLAAAYETFDEDGANRLLEESLALRSCERTIEDVLLAAVAYHAGGERPTAEYEFAWRHAAGWISALKRLPPPAHRERGVLVVDASHPLDLGALDAQSLELILRRAGVRTLLLSPAVEPTRLGRALRGLRPAAVVVSGRGADLDPVGRLVYAVRASVPDVAVFDYRTAVADARTACGIDDGPVAARDRVLARLEASKTARRSLGAHG